MTVYYNEIDPHAALTLANLIAAGHIAHGIVDTRSIEDVKPSDLKGFKQCHFFAGVGVWSLALRRAGWPDDREVWTGSCPCQPFSSAGEGAGFADERHLWPAFNHLIEVRRPAVVFGEQVASRSADVWIDLVCADLEAVGYAFGAIPFPAASVGAPHIRDRLYWVADTDQHGRRSVPEPGLHPNAEHDAQPFGSAGRVADTDGAGLQRGERGGQCVNAQLQTTQRNGQNVDQLPGPTNGHWRAADWLLCRDGRWRPVEPGASPLANGAPARVGRLRAYGNAIVAPQAEAFINAYLTLNHQ